MATFRSTDGNERTQTSHGVSLSGGERRLSHRDMAVPLFEPVQDLDGGRPLLAVEFSQDQNEGSGHPEGPRPEPTCAYNQW